MSDVTFEIIPLAGLAIAPANARFGRTVETADLEASIAAAGRLVTPLSCYRDGDATLVWDGGRRLLACQALAKARKLPASLKAGLPCLVYASAEAVAVDSLATFVREAMSPADEFAAYRRLTERGLSLTETAAACNVRTPRVQQLLRLVALAPEVLAAFEKGAIPLDVAEAFTLSENHDKQREILKVFNPKKDGAWGVRQQMRKGAVEASSRWAQFVGRAAYQAAGGAVLSDLFSNREQEDFADPELLDRLAKEKLEALRVKTEAEGWEWVEARAEMMPYDWNYKCPFDRLPGKKTTFTLEQKAAAGAIIFIGHNGQPEIERGLVKKAAKGKEATTAAGKAAQADPAMYGYGHGGHEHMTGIATGAVQVAIAADPAAAYDALLSSLAWTAFRENGRAAVDGAVDTHESNASSLAVEQGRYGFQSDQIAGMEALKSEAKAWKGRLPMTRVAFCDYVTALTPQEKSKLLAIAYAWTLNAVEHRFDYGRAPLRWRHLGWMARRAGVDVVKAWTPDVEFLKKGTREALMSAFKDMGGAYIGGAAGEGLHVVTATTYAKKGELVSAVQCTARKVGWVPKLLATLTDAADPTPAAKAAPKRMFSDSFADDVAEVAAETEAAD